MHRNSTGIAPENATMTETRDLKSVPADKERFARRLSIALLCLLTLASLLHFKDLYPQFIDVNYHMGAIEGMRQAGGLVLWDFWEQAPAGRPHLYPPTLHIAGRLACLLGMSPWAFVTLLSWAMWPVSLLMTWLLARRLSGERGGLLALALLAGPQKWFFCQAALTANAVALSLSLGAILLYLDRKYLAAGVAAFLAATTHGSGVVAVVTIVLASIPHTKLLLKRALPILAGVAVGCAPWAFHMTKHSAISEARFSDILQLHAFRFDYLLLPLALAGVVLLVREAVLRRRAGDHEEAVKAAVLPAFLLAFIVMFPMAYAHRFWGFNSFLPYSLLAAGVIVRSFGRLESRSRADRPRVLAWMTTSPNVALTVFALVAIAFVPVSRPSGGRRPPGAPGEPSRKGSRPSRRGGGGPMGGPGGFSFEPPAMAQILSGSGGTQRGGMGGNVRELKDFLSAAARHVKPGHLVHAPRKNGPLVTALTGAWTTGGMLTEVKSPEPPAEPEECDFLLDTGFQGGGMPGGFMGRGRLGGSAPPSGFEEVRLDGVEQAASPTRSPFPSGMFPGAMGAPQSPRLYRNTERALEMRKPPRAAVPTVVLLLGALGLAALAARDVASRRLPKRAGIGMLGLGGAFVALAWIWLGVRVLAEEPSVRPEWLGEGSLHRGQGGPGGRRGGRGGPVNMPPLPAIPPDTPEPLAGRVVKLRGILRDIVARGARPDYFWPPERERELSEHLRAGRFDEATRLLDRAADEYVKGYDEHAKGVRESRGQLRGKSRGHREVREDAGP